MRFRLFLVFILGLSMRFSFAQSFAPVAERATKEACTRYTKELITSLQLNESEYIKLKSLNMRFISKVAETNIYAHLASTNAPSPIAELELLYEAELQTILSPFQRQAYRAYKSQNQSVIHHLAIIALSNGRNRELLANRIAP